MNLLENPIFLTQKRLVHRTGVLAAILISALIGVSLLMGLLTYLHNPQGYGFSSKAEVGKMFYGWVLGVEGIIVIAGGFSRISRSLGEDRKAGLWDSNRLTPLYPWQLLTGYWLGAGLREAYMGLVLAILGLAIVVLANLTLMLWVGTQVLIISTALFFGLLGALVGLAFDRPRNGVILLLGFLFTQAFSMFRVKYMVTNFLLPIYAMGNLFSDERDWTGSAGLFGLHINPVLYSLALQVIVGFFLWRTAIRKTKDASQALLHQWEAIAVFTLLVVAQHGLMWGMWHGDDYDGSRYDRDAMMPTVHIGTLLLGTVMLAFGSPSPQRVRIDAMRTGARTFGMVFSRSALSLALAFGLVNGACLLVQGQLTLQVWIVVTGNLLTFFAMFALVLEFCRLKYQRRALSYIALILFVLCLLPYILAGVFSEQELGRISFLSPGVLALSDRNFDSEMLPLIVAAHGVVVVFLLGIWWQQWKRLLQKSTVSPAATAV